MRLSIPVEGRQKACMTILSRWRAIGAESRAWFLHRTSIRAHAKAANEARKNGLWPEAARHLASIAALDSSSFSARMQEGRSLRDADQLEQALIAYTHAASLNPDSANAHLQRGRILRLLGRGDEAKAPLRKALAISKAYPEARRELILMGEVDPEVGARETDEPSAYDTFRRTTAIPFAPGSSPSRSYVIIDAFNAAPFRVQASLNSLRDQTHADWHATVIAPSSTRDHPVGSTAVIDPRIRFISIEDADCLPADIPPNAPSLCFTAGLVLSPEALSWFAWASEQRPGAVVYCDHDMMRVAWPHHRSYHAPALQPAPDPYDLAGTPAPPEALLVPSDLLAGYISGLSSATRDATAESDVRRNLLIAAATSERAGQLALPLASISVAPARALRARVSPPDLAEGVLSPRQGAPCDPAKAETTTDATILVVIPTRDQVGLLRACIKSLKGKANRPALIRFAVADNRSVEPKTKQFLRRLGKNEHISIVHADEPFNWSRFNNISARSAPGDLIVFCNNDVEMITSGWDERVRYWLSRPDIGVVGCKLLYPSGDVQHAGMALGRSNGEPMHEGIGALADAHGPLDRWSRPRCAAAVTGAFLAVTRATFEATGGFCENLAIAYNDIDFCLRVRALGLRVLYDGKLELTHHESATRGFNDSRSRVAWDLGEWSVLWKQWGTALLNDPAINPCWGKSAGVALDGYAMPDAAATVRTFYESLNTPWMLQPRRTQPPSP